MARWNEGDHPRDDRGRFDDAEAARSAWAQRVAVAAPASSVPHASIVPPARGGTEGEGWWDETEPSPEPWMASEPERPDSPMSQKMRDWRALPEPEPEPEGSMDPVMTRAMRCDTPEGRAEYGRLRGYREAGYDGPLDEHCRIPDPDDPENWRWMRALA